MPNTEPNIYLYIRQALDQLFNRDALLRFLLFVTLLWRCSAGPVDRMSAGLADIYIIILVLIVRPRFIYMRILRLPYCGLCLCVWCVWASEVVASRRAECRVRYRSVRLACGRQARGARGARGARRSGASDRRPHSARTAIRTLPTTDHSGSGGCVSRA